MPCLQEPLSAARNPHFNLKNATRKNWKIYFLLKKRFTNLFIGLSNP